MAMSTPISEQPEVRASAGADRTTLAMLHCLLTMLLAAVALSSLDSLGLVGRPGPCPADAGGYSSCAVWQDARSALHFILGGLLPYLWQGSLEPAGGILDDREGDGVEKGALHTCLLW
mmetsp:Transcript_36326/g.93648  ORF Transcript_36326/g.93648 Transcript_36326/m.93648 type:complete len:118 (+) Transcript_36326:83-436(+)|eukprot:CAMPEP_0195073096 /NCGR_PEP_ID=MMETSP0448-20130528/16509_1 /TAXON_ID=66468 /ORGANISM="Heterocapsa triquestra, Strain CCMP 448" /LENGTH=117 /DNA_ID=CAMNT_0040105165 /DNA_START=80 /DNA_END=433 /DNA_ORIENTATION=-